MDPTEEMYKAREERDELRAQLEKVESFVRPELRQFAEAMELRLRENDHKSGWDEMGVPSAVERCLDEWRELDHALLVGSAFDQMHEAEDLANFAFFAWWNARKDREEPPEPLSTDFDHILEDED